MSGKVAHFPFNDSAHSDLVLRTSDDVLFFIQRDALMRSSDFFDGILSDASAEESYQNLPVCRVLDSSTIIYIILPFCHALIPPPSDLYTSISPSDVAGAIEAMGKYIMPDVKTRFLKALANSSTILKQHLHDILDIALHLEDDDILLLGVLKAVRSLPSDVLASQGIQALEEYRQACTNAAREALKTTPSCARFRVKYVTMDELRLATRQPGRPRKEGCCVQPLYKGVRMVFDNGGSDEWGHPSVKILLLLAKAALEISPDADLLRTEGFIQRAVAATCDCFSARLYARSIVQDIANTVEKAILAVCRL